MLINPATSYNYMHAWCGVDQSSKGPGGSNHISMHLFITIIIQIAVGEIIGGSTGALLVCFIILLFIILLLFICKRIYSTKRGEL